MSAPRMFNLNHFRHSNNFCGTIPNLGEGHMYLKLPGEILFVIPYGRRLEAKKKIV